MTPALTAIDILIEPDEATRERATRLNATLRDSFAAGFAFDETHRPHVTMLQRYTRAGELDAAIAAAGDVLTGHATAPPRLRAVGLVSGRFGTPPGIVLASIAFEPTSALRSLQAELIEAISPFAGSGGDATAFFATSDDPEVNAATIAYVEQFAPAHCGERYEPHLSVGVGREDLVARLAAEPFDDVRFSAAAFAIYRLGNLGTAREALRRWPTTGP